jgi:hypothetical protein
MRPLRNPEPDRPMLSMRKVHGEVVSKAAKGKLCFNGSFHQNSYTMSYQSLTVGNLSTERSGSSGNRSHFLVVD